MAATVKIQTTKNYRLFEVDSGENRPLDLKKHKKLSEAMQLYGFLPCYPIVVVRQNNKLIVKDGQHRLTIAETLGLPIWYVESEIHFDVAIVNCAAKTWALKDYALKHSANGLDAYKEGMEFADTYGLPLGTAFALLAGYVTFSHCQEEFQTGTFQIKDRPWADAVAGIYSPLSEMAPTLKNATFVKACMAVCRIPTFEAKRLLAGAKSCREKLVAYASKDAYLDMLQAIYNWKRNQLFDLKIQATMAMRERNAMNGKPKRGDEAA